MTVPAAISSPFHIASHVPHPPIARHSTCASSMLSPTLPNSHSNVDISSAPLPPRKKRPRRCFVCGGTGKHRLHPRFCPRTAELISKRLAMFNFDFRLVSFDGSPLPMTRHPGGVAAHLLSPRRLSARPVHVLSHQNSTSPCTCNSNPPHVAVAATIRPPTVEPNVDSNPPHTSHAATVLRCAIDASVDLDLVHAPHPSIVYPRTLSSPERGCESTLPHFPLVERLPSPPIYLPIRVPLPDSKPPADSSSEGSSPHISLSIFELLFVSPPIRDELRKLIDAMDRSKVGYEIPSSPGLRKVFYRILDQITDSLLSPR